MSDDRRIYSDDQFALILRKTAELASRAESPAPSSAGFTLTEMQAAAAQVGYDPALVERAARLVHAKAAASPIERLTGGPVRHADEARFLVTLDENRAARLLSAVRIHAGLAGSRDAGHSSAMGMTWHDGGELEALGVTAHAEADVTCVSLVLDRRGTLGVIVVSSAMGLLLAGLAGLALYQEAPVAALGASIGGLGATLAIARGFWASSTRAVRQRVSLVMDAVGQTLTDPDTQSSDLGRAGEGAVAPEPDRTGVETLR